MKLYGYFRSSAAYRVRIALALKGLAHDSVPVHLRRAGGEQQQPGFLTLNPAGLVPVLEDGPHILSQSLAIIEYLDEVYPDPPLLPASAGERARVRGLALSVACEIHPLNNLRVLKYLTGVLAILEDQKTAWYHHWIHEGFGALETLLRQSPLTGRFCYGNTPGLADCCLVPQVFNARRYGADLAAFPTITAIDAACREIPAFEAAHPDRQLDRE